MDLLTPRSTTLELRWRPCLDFYEHGVTLLRDLEDAGQLRRFKVTEHDVEARLADRTHLKVGVAGMSYTAASTELRAEAATDVVSGVLSRLTPNDVELVIYLQHLEALEWADDYPTACARVTRAWLPAVSDAAGFADCAPLVDGISPGHGLRYQAEFGVVDRDQAPHRIARWLGNRIGGPTASLEEEMRRGHPPLALFVDSTWTLQDAPPMTDDLTTWVMLKLQQSAEDAARLVSVLYTSCDGHNENSREGLEVSQT